MNEEFDIPEEDSDFVPQWILDREVKGDEVLENIKDTNDYSLGIEPHEDEGAIAVAQENEKAERSVAKKKAIENLVVKNNSVLYQGDDLSQLRMSSTIAIANQMFNRKLGETFTAMSQNPALPKETQAMFGGVGHLINEIYDAIYKDNKIAWRGEDKKMHNVEVESIAEALLKTMQALGGIITKDNK